MARVTGFLVSTIGAILAITSCSGNGNGSTDAGPDLLPLDVPLGPGEVRAGRVTRESELLSGPEAHGWLGDFKLYNHRVAFIVENIDEPRGWAPYGGTVLDAVRIRPGGEAGPDLFQELFTNIEVATVFPLSAEVVHDGRDGQAVLVRIEGRHQGIPLIDGALNGALEPRDLDIVHEYILEPDADFLRVRTSIRASARSGSYLQVGDMVLNGDRTDNFAPGTGIFTDDLGSRSYDYLAGYSPEVCYLYTGAEGSIDVLVSIEGVTPLVVVKGTAPPVRSEEESLVAERLLVVGDGPLDSCLRLLGELRETPGLGQVGGTVTTTDGLPEPGATVLALDAGLPDGANYVNQTYTGDDGEFEMQLPFGDYRLAVRAEGREEFLSDGFQVTAEQTSQVEIGLPPPSVLAYRCGGQDREGNDTGPLPCKVSLQSGHDADLRAPVDTATITFGVTGEGAFFVPAGDWTVTLSRGMEYGIHRQNVTTAPGTTVQVTGTLQHQIDSTGLIAADLHSHCTRSADNAYLIDDKIGSNICEGVELLVITDHDCQTDFTPFIEEMKQRLSFDLDEVLRTVTGNEVSPLYAHMTAFPLPTHPTGWIYWQVPWTVYEDGRFVRNREYPEMWEDLRRMGAEIINICHPLESSGYFHYLGFDPPDVMPRLDGLPVEKFGTGFDTMEMVNRRAVNQGLERILPLWSAMNNQGVFKTAVGVSDSHGRTSEGGLARTMVASSSDEPRSLDLGGVWASLRQRRAMVTTGIFVWISVGDAVPGDLTTLAAPFEVRLRVEAADWVPVQGMWLIANGETLATLPLEGPGIVDPQHPSVRFDDAVAVEPEVDTWYAAVAYGPDDVKLDPVFRDARAAGFTNAVQVDVDGNGRFDPPDP